MSGVDLSPSIPAFVSVGVVVVTVVLGLVVARMVKPTELMAETRAARADAAAANSKADAVRTEFNEFRDTMEGNYRTVARGFRALWRQMERLRAHWGDGDMPALDADDVADVEAARELLDGQQ